MCVGECHQIVTALCPMGHRPIRYFVNILSYNKVKGNRESVLNYKQNLLYITDNKQNLLLYFHHCIFIAVFHDCISIVVFHHYISITVLKHSRCCLTWRLENAENKVKVEERICKSQDLLRPAVRPAQQDPGFSPQLTGISRYNLGIRISL